MARFDIPEAELKLKVGSLFDHQQEVSEALDMLFVGFSLCFAIFSGAHQGAAYNTRGHNTRELEQLYTLRASRNPLSISLFICQRSNNQSQYDFDHAL